MKMLFGGGTRSGLIIARGEIKPSPLQMISL